MKKPYKSALCLMGIVGGRTGKNGLGGDGDFELCAYHYMKNIIKFKGNNTDVFIHTWSVEHSNKLMEIYKPKSAVFQTQINFGGTYAAHLQQSRWYSHNRVLELKQEYERKNGFKYQMVMVGRFDTMWFVPVDFKKFDPQYFWVSNWNKWPNWKGGWGENDADHSNNLKFLQDIWFVAESNLMDKFTDVFPIVEKHNEFKPNIHKILRGYFNERADIYKLNYAFYRWFDYELYRWYVLRNYR